MNANLLLAIGNIAIKCLVIRSFAIRSFANLHLKLVSDAGSLYTLGIRHQSHCRYAFAHEWNLCPFCLGSIRLAAIVRSFDFYHAVVFADNHSILGGYPEEFWTGILLEGIIPTLVADVLLGHHSVPLATRHLVVVIVADEGIALEEAFAFISPDVRLRIVLLVESMVLSLGKVHLVQIAHQLDREEDDLTVGIVIGCRQTVVLAQGICFELEILVHHLLPFAVL